jgi:hypothetical protein
VLAALAAFFLLGGGPPLPSGRQTMLPVTMKEE